jgi:hypothetical protein
MYACRKRTSGHFQRTSGYGAATTHAEAFRGGSRSKSGWRGQCACATIWSGARSAACWDRSASAPTSGAAGSAPAAATTRGRAVGGFGASRRSSPRRCGGNGAGSRTSSRCNAACGQAGAAGAVAPGRPIRHLGVVQRRLAAVARYGRFGLCPPRIVPVACFMARAAVSSFRANSAVWPL